MNIRGTYVVKSGDKVLAEFDNMLTTNGLLMINQYLTGNFKYWADSIAIGALATSSTTASTTTLQYESFRYPVLFKSYNTSGSVNQLILKTTIDPIAEFEAYEIGVFPEKVDNGTFADHYQITGFSEAIGASSLWYVNGSPAPITASTVTTSRVGSGNITLAVTTSSTTNTASTGSLSIPSGRYTENDYLAILYYVSSSISSTSVTVTFGDGSTPQLTWSGSGVISNAASGSFYSASIDMGAKSASFTDPILTASVQFRGSAGSVVLDHMKFYLGDNLIPDLKLVSRSISASPNVPLFTKKYSEPMDIEYYIRVT